MYQDSEHAAQTREGWRGDGGEAWKGGGGVLSEGVCVCVWRCDEGGVQPKRTQRVFAWRISPFIASSWSLLSMCYGKAEGGSERGHHLCLGVQSAPRQERRRYRPTHLQSVKRPLLPLCPRKSIAMAWPDKPDY